MGNPTHTPGPWDQIQYDNFGNGCFAEWYTVGTSEETICKVSGSNFKADAHLIAAAPELLAALKDMDEWFGPMADDDMPLACKDMVDKARAAIARAEKGQS